MEGIYPLTVTLTKYDASGSPMAVTYDGVTYYYATNLQGDIVAILDDSGNAVVEYTYNAWGKLLSTTGSMATTLGIHNPLRYRGYVYDNETSLYYLQSRYYDPQLGRFINADAFAATGQGLLGNNTFAYCCNNPITRIDSTGNAFDTVLDLISIGLSVADVISNPRDYRSWIGLGLDFVDLIPILTGTGEAYRAYKLADTVVEGFGSLSKAKEYGIMGYNSLRKALSGTGLQAHHIIEKRLVGHLGIDVDNMLSVAVTVGEHQDFTNAWRAAFKYGMDYSTLTVDAIWDVAQEIYKDYPELLKAAEEILYG